MGWGAINWKTETLNLGTSVRPGPRDCATCFSGRVRQVSCNSVVVKAALTAPQISPQWQGALPQCPALLTLGFPVAGLSQKHALLFEVLIRKADLSWLQL